MKTLKILGGAGLLGIATAAAVWGVPVVAVIKRGRGR